MFKREIKDIIHYLNWQIVTDGMQHLYNEALSAYYIVKVPLAHPLPPTYFWNESNKKGHTANTGWEIKI